jgi:hypothetical protein
LEREEFFKVFISLVDTERRLGKVKKLDEISLRIAELAKVSVQTINAISNGLKESPAD